MNATEKVALDPTLVAKCNELKTALRLILASVDYTRGDCAPTDPIAGALPREILDRARRAIS